MKHDHPQTKQGHHKSKQDHPKSKQDQPKSKQDHPKRTQDLSNMHAGVSQNEHFVLTERFRTSLSSAAKM